MAKAPKKAKTTTRKKGAEAKPARAARAPAGGPTASARVISKTALNNLIDALEGPASKINAAKQSMGGTISAAVNTQNLHKGAFRDIHRLHRMDDVKLAEYLLHFDTMREHLGLDKRTKGLDLGDREDGGDEGGGEPGGEDNEPADGAGGHRRSAPLAASPPAQQGDGVTPFRRVGDAIAQRNVS